MKHKMRQMGVSAMVLMAVALTGCGALQVTDGTGQTQPLDQWLESLKPANAMAQKVGSAPEVRGTQGSASAAADGCISMPSFALGTDVDTGYARAMRRFSLATAEEMQRLRQERTGVMIDPRYRHERQAGAYYRLAQVVRYPDGAGQTQKMFLDLSLAKDGARATAAASYCLDSNVTPAQHRAVQRFITDSLTTAL